MVLNLESMDKIQHVLELEWGKKLHLLSLTPN